MRPRDALLTEMRAQAAIAAQTQAAAALLAGVEELASEVRRRGRLRVTGMGASLHAGLVLTSLLRSGGVDADAVVTSELVHYGPARWEEPLLVISQSGASAEVEALLAQSRRLPRLWGLTLDPSSPLGGVRSLVVPGGPERAYAATRSFTGTLDVLLRLHASLGGDPSSLASGHRALADLVSQIPALGVAPADALEPADTVIVTGRGALAGVAEYGALLFMELRRRPTLALEAAQLRHGPLEAVGPSTGVVALRAEGPTTELMDRLLRDAALLEGPVVVVNAGSDAAPVGNNVLDLRLGRLDEPAAALAAPVVLQAAAVLLAERAGIEPGQPLRASKVTRQE